jgi:2-polyprenyl-3-methyl-5-hydroxy-6-metoxy-1,4-benzoquinol methylase
MPDLSKRSAEVEIMDDLECSGEVVHQTLRELEVINTLLGGNHVTLDGIRKLAVSGSPRTLHVADLGCGGGDILRLMHRWAKRKRFSLQLTGIDANPHIVAFAAAHTSPEDNIAYEAVDIFSCDFASREFDIVTGTLFYHHFSEQQLTEFFRQLKTQVRVGFVINDIHRHWFAYYSILWLTRIFSKSPMVKFDAPLSVCRAFRKNELRDILRNAGIETYSMRWMWAFRWQVIVTRN